ncbi:MAG: hypothetical protein LC104_00830 [Bacteroidales bacterium]|nr:hypothetical protein [Bacteroidales bacterium]
MAGTRADPFVPVIRDALETAKGRTLMSLDEEADAAWDGGGLYRRLDDRPEGVPGAITGRAADMVMKLAMVYALADGDDAIRLVHLRAGLAVWRYCEATAFALFGGPTPDAEPEPLWLRLTNTIAQRPGISRSELTVTHRRFGNANAIGETLDKVKANGLAHCRFTQNPNGGPKRECWYPGPGDGGGDGGEPNNILPPPPAVVPGSHGPVNPFAGCVVEGDGSPITGKQTTNPPTGVDPQGGIVVWLPAERGGPGDRDEVKGQEVVRYVRHAAWPRLCRASNTAWPTLLAFSTAWMRRVQNLKQEVTAHHRPRLRASCRPMTRRVKVLLFSRCRKKPGSCVPTASGSGLVLFLKF